MPAPHAPGSLRIPRSVVVGNGKGGVGKTAVAANLAGLAAEQQPVIALDLDPAPDMGREFGIQGDGGNGLAACALGYRDAPILHPTRIPDLWYIPGGPELHDIVAVTTSRDGGSPAALAAKLKKAVSAAQAEVAATTGRVPLVVIDTAPSSGDLLSDAGLLLGARLVLPTRMGLHDLEGLAETYLRLIHLAETGHGLPELAGVVLVAVNQNATRMHVDARTWLDDHLGGTVPLLDRSIRWAEQAQVQRLQLGATAAEFAALAGTVPPWHEQLRLPAAERIQVPRNAQALADDYRAVAAELGLIPTVEVG